MHLSDGGVGFLIHKNHGDNILSVKKISARVVYLILKLSKKYTIKIIQAYAPTTIYSDQDIEIFYDNISSAPSEAHTHFTILCGDFNTKIGLNAHESELCLGNFGSDGRNNRGTALLNFLL